MRNLKSVLLRAGLLAGVTMLAAGASAPAYADCFEVIGCTDSDHFRQSDLRRLSCENLWFVRNRIYDENGYCFKTARARREFDNSDCWVDAQSQVKLSAIERSNVDAIVRAESARHCD